jgi:hypothetical protein
VVRSLDIYRIAVFVCVASTFIQLHNIQNRLWGHCSKYEHSLRTGRWVPGKVGSWWLGSTIMMRQDREIHMYYRSAIYCYFMLSLILKGKELESTPSHLLLLIKLHDSPSRKFRLLHQCWWLWLKRSKIQTRHQRRCLCGCVFIWGVSLSGKIGRSRCSGMFGMFDINTCHCKL